VALIFARTFDGQWPVESKLLSMFLEQGLGAVAPHKYLPLVFAAFQLESSFQLFMSVERIVPSADIRR
jgi:hypothetical protein